MYVDKWIMDKEREDEGIIVIKSSCGRYEYEVNLDNVDLIEKEIEKNNYSQGIDETEVEQEYIEQGLFLIDIIKRDYIENRDEI